MEGGKNPELCPICQKELGTKVSSLTFKIFLLKYFSYSFFFFQNCDACQDWFTSSQLCKISFDISVECADLRTLLLLGMCTTDD